MAKSKKRKIGIGIFAVVLILAVAALIFFYPVLIMKPTETGTIKGTEITAVQNSKNALYFIRSARGYVVIDAGTDKDKVEKTLKALAIDPSEVQHVLLTHTDYDHVGSLPLFTNAQLYMNEDERQMLDGSIKRNALGYNSLPEGVDIDSIELLTDYQQLSLDGISVRCIKAPGHTPGSMIYLVNGAYLFTGDAARISNNRLMVHPFSMDKEEAQNSFDIIKSVRSESILLFTAHYGYYNFAELE